MKKVIAFALLTGASLYAADSVKSWFEEGTAKGYIRYYFIETKKDNTGSHTSAHANSIGGVLSYTTGDLYGFQAGATFMTTNGFALPSSVDASILGRDNGVRLEGDPSGAIAQESFSVLGEAFIKYKYKGFNALYGRQVYKTPLIDAKDVRMLPSAVQGAFVNYEIEHGAEVGASYLTHIKQRTSNKFINIVKHALGDQTRLITGNNEGEVIVLGGEYKGDHAQLKVYDYYADNFMNSFYLDATFQNKLSSGYSYVAGIEYINQVSIGHSDNTLAADPSIAGGSIDANALALKIGMGYSESKFELAVSKVMKNSDKHDALVLPWDGTPLYTNMITSNDLFQSNYGKALTADSVYIGGSEAIKLSYTQTYDFTGVKGFKTVLAYLNLDNDKFPDRQEDLNAVIAYGIGDFSLALKGIWVKNNTSANADGSIKPQDDTFTQYRVIANYNF
jgi:hypothetical protein